MPLHYNRVRICGSLTCMSDVHVGEGALPQETTERLQDKKSQQAGKETARHYNGVCLNHENKPCIPGSSLRGALRELLAQHESLTALFGSAAKQGDPLAGHVRVSDARWRRNPQSIKNLPYWSETRSTCLRHGVAIDAISRTAKENHLFTTELVPKDSVFSWELYAEDIHTDDLQALMRALSLLTGKNPRCALGTGKGKGWGLLKWETETLEGITQEALATWLTHEQPLDTCWETISLPTDKVPSPKSLPFSVHIVPQSPLLVHEAGFIDSKGSQQDGDPVLMFDRDHAGKARIPASSLRGMVRAQAHKIAATIAHLHYEVAAKNAHTCVEPLIEALFGGERWRGFVYFGEALSQKQAETHRQTFNAIDRFTGGVADGALYSVEAAICDVLRSDLFLEEMGLRSPNSFPKIAEVLPKNDAWWQGLLLLVLRDAMDGELSIGWGRARGYGAFFVHVEYAGRTHENWENLYKFMKQEAAYSPDTWIQSLHDKIADLTKQESAR
jgi:CRISPR/Cas system CSM-associated protein Csm3 (group 7 of RAMP superfamily)